MGKSQRRKKPQRRGRGSPQSPQSGRNSKPFGWRRLGRRVLIGVAILAIPLLVVGLEIRDNLQRSDLSVIGTGKPVVVQAHDPQCPDCRSLLDNAEAAHADFHNQVAFRVVDLNSGQGQAFARRFDVGKVTLVVFDGEGEVKSTLRGVRSVQQLRQLFAGLGAEPAGSS